MKKMNSKDLHELALKAAKKLEEDLAQHAKPGAQLKMRTGLKAGELMV